MTFLFQLYDMGIIALGFITFYSNKPENPKAQKPVI
jgi:hypothetical protein